MAVSRETWEAIEAAGLPDVAQYAVSMAYRIRFVMQMTAREAMHLTELRSQPTGHPVYRRSPRRCTAASRACIRRSPRPSRTSRYDDVDLERLEAERRTEAQARQPARRARDRRRAGSSPSSATASSRALDVEGRGERLDRASRSAGLDLLRGVAREAVRRSVRAACSPTTARSSSTTRSRVDRRGCRAWARRDARSPARRTTRAGSRRPRTSPTGCPRDGCPRLRAARTGSPACSRSRRSPGRAGHRLRVHEPRLHAARARSWRGAGATSVAEVRARPAIRTARDGRHLVPRRARHLCRRPRGARALRGDRRRTSTSSRRRSTRSARAGCGRPPPTSPGGTPRPTTHGRWSRPARRARRARRRHADPLRVGRVGPDAPRAADPQPRRLVPGVGVEDGPVPDAAHDRDRAREPRGPRRRARSRSTPPTRCSPTRSTAPRPTPTTRSTASRWSPVEGSARSIPLAPPMDRDATFLLSLVMLAVAALAVGVSGWVLFLRDRRAPQRSPRPPPTIPRTDEDSLMLDVLDLRERGGRLEPTKLEIDPATPRPSARSCNASSSRATRC